MFCLAGDFHADIPFSNHSCSLFLCICFALLSLAEQNQQSKTGQNARANHISKFTSPG